MAQPVLVRSSGPGSGPSGGAIAALIGGAALALVALGVTLLLVRNDETPSTAPAAIATAAAPATAAGTTPAPAPAATTPTATAAVAAETNFLAYLDQPAMQDAANGTFTTFRRLARAARVEFLYNGPGPMTAFVPTDEAFAREFTAAQLDALVANPIDLARLINFHVANGTWPVSKVADGTIPTIEGNELHGSLSEGVLRVNGSAARTTAIRVRNGYVYAVNDVLLPPSFAIPSAS